MAQLFLRHHNNCSKCPVIGAEDIPGEEYYDLKWMRFNIRIAREIAHGRVPVLVEPAALTRWLEDVHIDPEHVGHVPLNAGPGLQITLPAGCGEPIIDGNHRAARALREGRNFFVVVLDQADTLHLLRRSMGSQMADYAWRLLAGSKPHPDDL